MRMPEHLACLPSFPLKKSNQMVSTVSACIGRATRSSRTGIPTTAGHMPQWDDASVRQAARSYNHEGNVTMAPVLSPPIQIGLSVACGKVTHSRLRIEVEAPHPPKLRPADGLNIITTFEGFHHVDSQWFSSDTLAFSREGHGCRPFQSGGQQNWGAIDFQNTMNEADCVSE